MARRVRLLALFLLCILSGGALSCLSNPAELGSQNDYVAQLDLLWHNFDTTYVGFVFTDADWDQLYDEYLPEVEAARTQTEFLNVLTEMLAHLEDAHIRLYQPAKIWRPTYMPEIDENYDMDVLWSYIDSLSDDGFHWIQEDIWGYAMMDSIPYVMVRSMNDLLDPSQLSALLDTIPDSRPVIIDLRMNPGGSVYSSKGIAARFSDEWRLVWFNVYREGPDGYGLGEPVPEYLYPARVHGGPVIALIGEYCASAAEYFALCCRAVPTITLAGDTTMGQINGAWTYGLGFGCMYTLPFVTSLAADTVTLIQEVGVAPDLYVEATGEDFAAGTDPVLEYALEWVGQQ